MKYRSKHLKNFKMRTSVQFTQTLPHDNMVVPYQGYFALLVLLVGNKERKSSLAATTTSHATWIVFVLRNWNDTTESYS